MKSSAERHPEALQLFKNILLHSDEHTARQIAYGLPLAPNATPGQRAAWVQRVIEALEERFDATTIKAIRLGYYCNDQEVSGKCTATGSPCADAELFGTDPDWLRESYLSSDSLGAVAETANTENLGRYVEDVQLYTKFMECECPMLEAVGQMPGFTWCYCTAGYGKRLFESVFGFAVDLEILHTIRQGNEFCLMKVVPL